jgi:2-hydroxychromene-2-carboxylate isomerase
VRHHHRERLDDYLLEAFRAYWAIEFDPENEAEVAALIDSLGGDPGGRGTGGLDAGAFRAWSQREGTAALEQLAEALRAQGVFGVPSYLVEGEYFLGRQHLPMIAWILAGRGGRIPI